MCSFITPFTAFEIAGKGANHRNSLYLLAGFGVDALDL
jgi:hypothetical protein